MTTEIDERFELWWKDKDYTDNTYVTKAGCEQLWQYAIKAERERILALLNEDAILEMTEDSYDDNIWDEYTRDPHVRLAYSIRDRITRALGEGEKNE